MKQEIKDESLGRCMESNCKAKAKLFRFCLEHFDHFKFGIIRKDGTYPKDREQKLIHFERLGKK